MVRMAYLVALAAPVVRCLHLYSTVYMSHHCGLKQTVNHLHLSRPQIPIVDLPRTSWELEYKIQHFTKMNEVNYAIHRLMQDQINLLDLPFSSFLFHRTMRPRAYPRRIWSLSPGWSNIVSAAPGLTLKSSGEFFITKSWNMIDSSILKFQRFSKYTFPPSVPSKILRLIESTHITVICFNLPSRDVVLIS